MYWWSKKRHRIVGIPLSTLAKRSWSKKWLNIFTSTHTHTQKRHMYTFQAITGQPACNQINKHTNHTYMQVLTYTPTAIKNKAWQNEMNNKMHFAYSPPHTHTHPYRNTYCTYMQRVSEGAWVSPRQGTISPRVIFIKYSMYVCATMLYAHRCLRLKCRFTNSTYLLKQFTLLLLTCSNSSNNNNNSTAEKCNNISDCNSACVHQTCPPTLRPTTNCQRTLKTRLFAWCLLHSRKCFLRLKTDWF